MTNFYYLKKNNLVSKEDLKSVTELFNLATSIVDELNLPSEKYILRIAQIVRSALDFAIATSGSDATEDEIKELSKDYAIDLCDQFNIRLNESREAIIGKLIDLGLDSVCQQPTTLKGRSLRSNSWVLTFEGSICEIFGCSDSWIA